MTIATTSTSLLWTEAIDELYRTRILVNDDPTYLTRYDGFDFESEFGAGTRIEARKCQHKPVCFPCRGAR